MHNVHQHSKELAELFKSFDENSVKSTFLPIAVCNAVLTVEVTETQCGNFGNLLSPKKYFVKSTL